MRQPTDFLDHRLVLLESAHDSRDLDSETIRALWPDAVELSRCLYAMDWPGVAEAFKHAWNQAVSPQDKAYLLQWAVGAAETKWDIKWRQEFLALWKQVPDWQSNPYCRFFKTYHDALTCYFEGALRDAEARFLVADEICTQYGYTRGRVRTCFHLGLIEKERRSFKNATFWFRQALSLARQTQAKRWVERTLGQLSIVSPTDIGPGDQVDVFRKKKDEMTAALVAHDFRLARKLIIEAELYRRSIGLHRRATGFVIYTPLMLIGLGKTRLAAHWVRNLRDPLRTLQFYELKSLIFGLSDADQDHVDWLRRVSGVSSVLMQSGDRVAIEICGVKLSLQDADVQSLMLLLIEAETAVDKEKIVQKIWHLNYDPVVHDRKVYKLIQKAKRAFRRSDLFQNRYGSYGLNPQILGKKVSA